MADFTLPRKKAVVFWPVGCGDSTTLVLRPNDLIMQIDLRHLEKASDKNEPEWPIVDHLVKALPKKNGRPYLALFVLTHPDEDHIQGFSELLRRVNIGELWHTPKVFRDQSDQEGMCDDAKAFRKEVDRRRKAILAAPNAITSGDRLRVIGHDDILGEDRYVRLPASCKSRPGERVTTVDGIDLQREFHAFIHAPFKDDQARSKNETSLSLNVVLIEGDKYGQFFFFGDREYETIMQIFTTTEAVKSNVGYLFWNVLLAAHHCSKAVMYSQGPDDAEPVFKRDIMEFFEKYSRDKSGYVVASAHTDFSDGPGDNPPHKKARQQYEKIVKPGRFLVTHEYPTQKSPCPIVFVVDENGFGFDDTRTRTPGPAGLAAAIPVARGGTQPPTTQTGFGHAK